MADTTLKDPSIITMRVPASLRAQLEAVAQRDANNISAVIRRLLSRALVHETGEGQ